MKELTHNINGQSEMEKGSPEWKEYRTLYKQASNLELLEFPIQIDFELNSSCNLRCAMCAYSALSRKKTHTIGIDFFKNVMTYAVSQGTRALKLNFMNEPLLRKDFFDFVQCAEDVGVLDIYFSTNGMLLTDEVINKILKSKISRVQISIDAASKETYDKVRTGGNYDTVVQNVLNLINRRKELNKESPLVRVSFVKSEVNEHEEQKFIKMWENICDMIGIQEFVPAPSKDIVSYNSIKRINEDFKCAFPFRQLVIAADKEVYPCCTFWGMKMSLGTLENPKDLKKFWRGHLINHLREIHARGEFYRLYQCKKCSGE